MGHVDLSEQRKHRAFSNVRRRKRGKMFERIRVQGLQSRFIDGGDMLHVLRASMPGLLFETISHAMGYIN